VLPLHDCFAQEINMFCRLDRFVRLWISHKQFQRNSFVLFVFSFGKNGIIMHVLSSMFVRLNYVTATDWMCLISLAGQSKDY
jgi:hypothetical protein